MSSSTATLTLPAPTPHLRAVPPLPPTTVLPEGATVVATLPQSVLPPALLAQYGARSADPGRPLVGYLVLVPGEHPHPQPQLQPEPPTGPTGRGIDLDQERRTAHVDGTPLELTYLEFELLAHLIAHPHRVHTRDHLVEVVWGYGHVGDGRTVDVHVARLRRKLGSAHRTSIVTVRRVGYKYSPIG